MKERPRDPGGELLGGEPSLPDIGSLVAGAGSREEIPEADFRRIREAAREAWQGRLAAISRPRPRVAGWLALAACVLIAVGLGWLVSRSSLSTLTAPVGRLEQVVGEVRPAALRVGAGLFPGTRLETGETGTATLRLAGGASLYLDAGTVVQLAAPPTIRLERGALYVDSNGASDGAIVVATPVGDVREIGTRFEVRLAPAPGLALAVSVREGRVRVADGGAGRDVAAGERLVLGADGSLTTSSLAVDDSAWSWVGAATEALVIEGRHLDEVVADYVRLTGRAVRFADRALAVEAATVKLHGNVDGLTADETLAVAVAGAGLRLDREEETVVVSRPGRRP